MAMDLLNVSLAKAKEDWLAKKASIQTAPPWAAPPLPPAVLTPLTAPWPLTPPPPIPPEAVFGLPKTSVLRWKAASLENDASMAMAPPWAEPPLPAPAPP